MRKTKKYTVAGIIALAVLASLSGCQKDQTTGADTSAEAEIEETAEIEAVSHGVSGGAVSTQETDWLEGGGENDDFYAQTCEWKDYTELYKNSQAHAGERIAAAVSVSWAGKPIYRANDLNGNEYVIYDDRKIPDQDLAVNDIVEIYGEYRGLGKDCPGLDGVGDDDFVVKTRVVRFKNDLSSLSQHWSYGPNPSAPESQEGAASTGDMNDGGVPADVKEKLEQMAPLMDGLLMAYLETGGAASYSPKEGGYFWMAMYTTLVNHGLEHPLVTSQGDTLHVPAMAAREYASATFFDYDDLLLEELAADPLNGITYSADLDELLVNMSDRGMNYTEILSYRDLGEGKYMVTAQLVDAETGVAICRGTFDMTGNPYADGIADPRFYYSITQADIWQ